MHEPAGVIHQSDPGPGNSDGRWGSWTWTGRTPKYKAYTEEGMYHRDMTEALLHHEVHGLMHAVLGRARLHLVLGRHDLLHQRLGRFLALHKDLGQVVCSTGEQQLSAPPQVLADLLTETR